MGELVYRQKVSWRRFQVLIKGIPLHDSALATFMRNKHDRMAAEFDPNKPLKL